MFIFLTVFVYYLPCSPPTHLPSHSSRLSLPPPPRADPCWGPYEGEEGGGAYTLLRGRGMLECLRGKCKMLSKVFGTFHRLVWRGHQIT